MSSTKTYTFTDSDNYNFTDTEIEVDDSAALKLNDDTGLTFEQAFTSDSGFTYDSNKAEFTAGVVRQKDMCPANATFGANYNNSINGNWGNGVLTGTAFGGAAINGGKLDLAHNDIRYVDYDANNNADSQQVGCVRFKYIPNYSGANSTEQTLFCISHSVGNSKNLILIRHRSGTSAGSYLNLHMYDENEALIKESLLGHFTAVQGQEYEFELNYDLTTGATRFFKDGIQQGSTVTETGVRSSDISLLRIGTHNRSSPLNVSNFKIEDFVIFNTVQHTANYTPGYNIEDYVYLESKVELPQFSYSGEGSIQTFTNIVTVETNAPREVWNDLYWDGSNFVSSNGSWSESSPKSDFLAHISVFPLSDTIDIDIVFNDNNSSQQSIDNLILTYTGQIYLTTNPIISPINLQRIWAEDLYTFVPTTVITGTDAIQYILVVDGTKTYWNGSNWVASNGTYSQSNDLVTIQTNIGTLISIRKEMGLDIFLHSNNGSTTPSISNLVITYDEALPNPTNLPRLVDINGYVYDSNGPVSGQKVYARSYQKGVNNPNDGSGGGVFQMYEYKLIGTTVADGYFSGQSYRQPTGEYIEFKIKKRYYTELPDQDAVDFNSLTLVVSD